MIKPNIAIASIIYGEDDPPAGNYTNAIETNGGRPFFVGAIHTQEDADYIYDHFDGLLLTGGDDITAEYLGVPLHKKAVPVPIARDETEYLLARTFVAGKKPVLAICRGEQVLNAALGGTHCQHLYDRPEVVINHSNRETRHKINVFPGSLLSRIFDGATELTVNSTHHQCVEQLAPVFTLGALSPDGIVESYDAQDRILATQFHPERLLSEGMTPIFKWFVGKCLEFHTEK